MLIVCFYEAAKSPDKCRVKRAFEAALPPLNDLQQLPRRQQFLEAWEAQEWADKEASMEAKQVSPVVGKP